MFWNKGFQILQNIQDRMTLTNKLMRAKDPITKKTVCKEPDKAEKSQKQEEHLCVSVFTPFHGELI